MKVRVFLEGKWVKYSAQEEIQERTILATLTRMGMRNADQYKADKVDHNLPIGAAELQVEIANLHKWKPQKTKGFYYNEHSRKVDSFINACLMIKASGVRDKKNVADLLNSELAWYFLRNRSSLSFEDWYKLSFSEKMASMASRDDFKALQLVYHTASARDLDAMRREMHKEPEWWYKGLLQDLSNKTVKELLEEPLFQKTPCGRQTKKIRDNWAKAGLSDPRNWHIDNIANFGQTAIEIKI